MDSFDKLEEHLLDALMHLHDRDYQPPDCLYTVTRCAPENGAMPVQSAIIRQIESLEPAADIPKGAHSRRVFDVLYHRYVLKLTLEETAELLHLSVRHQTRVQRDAVHTLARILWERRQATSDHLVEESDTQAGGEEMADWRSQARRELASLRASSPDTVADVRKAIDEVVELASTLVSGHGVHLEVEFVQPGLTAAIHPSVLRQALITVMARLAKHTATGNITIFAVLEDGQAKITVASAATTEHIPSLDGLVRHIVVPETVSIEVDTETDHVLVRIKVASVGDTTVLVVDDNLDMVHFYRRCTVGTRYRIVHVPHGRDAIEAAKAKAPHIIVLDVMLPDIDGWQLLRHLREDPATRSIPIIVCSVVGEQELALSLGATLYLSKPIRPAALIRALDRILPQA